MLHETEGISYHWLAKLMNIRNLQDFAECGKDIVTFQQPLLHAHTNIKSWETEHFKKRH
jgi:hypothetical protein